MAVYTTLTQSHIDSLILQYGLGSVQAAHPIAEGVENSNYILEYTTQAHQSQRAILTIFERRVSAVDIPFYMKLKQHLHESGICCPVPYLTNEGYLSCKIGDKHAVIVSFLEGKSILQPEISHVKQAGETLATMHKAAQSFPMTRPNAMSFTGWHQLRDRIAAHKEGYQHPILTVIDNELAYLHARWPHDLPSGIIHADLFPNNVFFNRRGELSGVIDFYFACHDLLVYDLAIVANAWCVDQKGGMIQAYYDALIQSYHSVRPLNDTEYDALPVLLRAAALRFLLTRLHDAFYHDPDALLTPHDPDEYLAILRFHQQQYPEAEAL